MTSKNMKLRLFALQRTISSIRFYQARNYASNVVRCDAHMNELPIPCGPWDIWYKDKQSYYNKVLVFGALWWLFSLGMMIHTESMYLNWGPPEFPGPPSDAVEECEDVE